MLEQQSICRQALPLHNTGKFCAIVGPPDQAAGLSWSQGSKGDQQFSWRPRRARLFFPATVEAAQDQKSGVQVSSIFSVRTLWEHAGPGPPPDRQTHQGYLSPHNNCQTLISTQGARRMACCWRVVHLQGRRSMAERRAPWLRHQAVSHNWAVPRRNGASQGHAFNGDGIREGHVVSTPELRVIGNALPLEHHGGMHDRQERSPELFQDHLNCFAASASKLNLGPRQEPADTWSRCHANGWHCSLGLV